MQSFEHYYAIPYTIQLLLCEIREVKIGCLPSLHLGTPSHSSAMLNASLANVNAIFTCKIARDSMYATQTSIYAVSCTIVISNRDAYGHF